MHPYHKHSGNVVGRKRAKHILKEYAEGGIIGAAKLLPPSQDENYIPENPKAEFPESYKHRDREASSIKTIIPRETGDRSVIYPEMLYDWKSEDAPNKSRRGGKVK